jgi:hypothetical protein
MLLTRSTRHRRTLGEPCRFHDSEQPRSFDSEQLRIFDSEQLQLHIFGICMSLQGHLCLCVHLKIEYKLLMTFIRAHLYHNLQMPSMHRKGPHRVQLCQTACTIALVNIESRG